jgi:3D-(3,5/4)-trihydroxycyclohexane-1,2-dione acylhydrolase (decyclizing)
VNVNVASFDAAKHSGLALTCDARAGLGALREALEGHRVDPDWERRAREEAAAWWSEVERLETAGNEPLPSQAEVIGAVNAAAGPADVVVCAAGSMPGDLHKLWRSRDPKDYHVEYGYSCMGYEIAGGIGVRMADPGRDVFVLVGDGSYLMMPGELVTAVQEHIKIIVVLVQNHGFASIGALSEDLGSQRFGTAYRYRDPGTGRLDGGRLPVDLAANAQSLGATVLRARTVKELRTALEEAKTHQDGPVVVHIETDPLVPSPSSQAWWDVPVAEVSALDSTTRARATYDANKPRQRPHL